MLPKRLNKTSKYPKYVKNKFLIKTFPIKHKTQNALWLEMFKIRTVCIDGKVMHMHTKHSKNQRLEQSNMQKRG